MIEEVKRFLDNHAVHEEVESHIPLAPLTSLHCGGPADILIRPKYMASVMEVLRIGKILGIPVTLLGNGTNVLIPDEGLRGIVLLTTGLKQIAVKPGELTAECGVSVNNLCRTAAGKGFKGIERLYGIPGTVGGAVLGNAGCFGSEISDTIAWVETLLENGNIYVFSKEKAGFSYRSSLIGKNSRMITRVCFSLPERADPKLLGKTHQEYEEMRRTKGHYRHPSAGSVFKKPVTGRKSRYYGMSAGELIEMAGLKGVSQNGARIAEYHANFIINPESRAHSSDILDLITLARRKVEEKTGVLLECELRILQENGQPLNLQ
ncbi:MAG: UDP-N-acetylmuramate dehydrogenase [Spirochaetia bacterium]|nr:UDP-N-acetylmuramate dehydrogenase [Spirochaetia bacterium]